MTENGYKLVADTIISEAKMLRERLAPQSKPDSNSAGGKGSESWAWGGFFCTASYGKKASVNVSCTAGKGASATTPTANSEN